MANTVRLSQTLRTAVLTTIRDAFDAGAGAGEFICYTAPIPSTGAAITTQTKLATLTLSDPCGTVLNDELTFSAITSDSSGDADGDIAWVRGVDSTGAIVCDLDASVSAGTGAIKFNSLSVVTGAPVAITSAKITMTA